MKEKFCMFNGELETPHCETCAFSGLQCEFLKSSRDAWIMYNSAKREETLANMKYKLREKNYEQNLAKAKKKEKNWWEQPKEKHVSKPFGTGIVAISEQEKKAVPEVKPKQPKKPDWSMMAWIFFSSFLSATILALILQFCAIMTDLMFGILGAFFNMFIGEHDNSAWSQTAEESFFYAPYGQAYIYSVVIIHMIAVWAFGGEGNKWANILRAIVTTYAIIASFMMPQLFLSVAIGPLFIFWCLAVAAKK